MAKTNMSKVQKVAEIANQTGHSAPYKSPFLAQQKADAEQAAQHSRDMARIQKLNDRGQK